MVDTLVAPEKKTKLGTGSNEKINVMVNGLPGKMASKVFEHITKSDNMRLIWYSLTGPEIEQDSVFGDIKLIKPKDRDFRIGGIIEENFPFISVDFTQPNAVNDNADFYCRNKLPFVMGTTGGERGTKKEEPGKLELSVMNSDISAVIAPNMAKQIVAFQALMEDYSKESGGALKDCKLSIIESHQQGKKDTSGTARAMVKYFNDLGIPFTADKIDMIREPKKQLGIGVPEKYLGGHAWHRYILSSKKGDAAIFQFGFVLKDFLLRNAVFAEYDSFGEIPKIEGREIIGNLQSIENVVDNCARPDKKYRISKDGTVCFSLEWFSNKLLVFNHNVNGRDIYASGTLDAIRYLDKKVKEGSKGQVYSMIDVLKGE